MAYEARQAEIMDQLTREKSAREEGLKEGLEKGLEKGLERGIEKNKLETAKMALMMNLPLDQIEKLTGLSKDIIKSIKH